MLDLEFLEIQSNILFGLVWLPGFDAGLNTGSWSTESSLALVSVWLYGFEMVRSLNGGDVQHVSETDCGIRNERIKHLRVTMVLKKQSDSIPEEGWKHYQQGEQLW